MSLQSQFCLRNFLTIVEETADKYLELQLRSKAILPLLTGPVKDGEDCRFGTPKMGFGGEGSAEEQCFPLVLPSDAEACELGHHKENRNFEI